MNRAKKVKNGWKGVRVESKAPTSKRMGGGGVGIVGARAISVNMEQGGGRQRGGRRIGDRRDRTIREVERIEE